MKWKAPIIDDPSQAKGLLDSSSYHFNHDSTNSLIRESFQNSLDAADKTLDKPVKIIFKLHKISRQSIPNFEGGLRNMIARMRTMPFNTTGKSAKWFQKLYKRWRTNSEFSDVLEISDYNTTGAEGEYDGTKNSWHSLTKGETISTKSSADSKGSFGIGKAAISNVSNFKFVFYTTFTKKENKFKCIGTGKLSSWKDSDGTNHDQTFYLCDNNSHSYVSDLSSLPNGDFKDIIKRDKQGVSQFVFSPILDKNKWVKEYKISILKNYWKEIYDDNLIVELWNENELKVELNKNNLNSTMKSTFENFKEEAHNNKATRGNPLVFYDLYHDHIINKKEPIKKQIIDLGEVKLYFKYFKENPPPEAKDRLVSHLRDNMLIKNQTIHMNGHFIGLLFSDYKKTNIIFKEMEGPAHNEFSYEHIKNDETDAKTITGKKLTSEIGNKILKALRNFINDVAREEHSKAYENSSATMTKADNMFRSKLGLDSTETDNNNESSLQEIVETSLKEKKIKISFKKDISKIKTDETITISKGKDDGDSGSSSGGSGKGKGKSDGDNPGEGSGSSGGDEFFEAYLKDRDFSKKSFLIMKKKNLNLYKIIIDSDKVSSDVKKDIIIKQQGDSITGGDFQIVDVKSITKKSYNKNIETVSKERDGVTGFKLKAIPLPNTIFVQVKETYKSSFIIEIK